MSVVALELSLTGVEKSRSYGILISDIKECF